MKRLEPPALPVWTEEKFSRFYENGYFQDWRKEYLENRTRTIMQVFSFGSSILCIGGALGWGLTPLVEKGASVLNYDTSPYIERFSHLATVKPQKEISAKRYFDTVYTEDILLTTSDMDIIELCSFIDSLLPKKVLHFTTIDTDDRSLPPRTAETYRTLLDHCGFSHHKMITHNDFTRII